jgi:hypothetical protein
MIGFLRETLPTLTARFGADVREGLLAGAGAATAGILHPGLSEAVALFSGHRLWARLRLRLRGAGAAAVC